MKRREDAAGDEGDDRELVSAVAPRAPAATLPSEDDGPKSGAVRLTRELAPGTIINSKYRVDAVLGRGAMGVVVACEHLELRERVALKFLLKAGYAAGQDFALRFLREAQVCAKLKNQHITRVVDVGTWQDGAFMVMELLDGQDLRHVMQATKPMPVAKAVDYVVQLCEGLAEAHAKGIVHRDLKPSNVFVVRNVDGSDLVKILDFGISKVLSDAEETGGGDRTETGFVLGSPKYMSPEQLFETHAVGPHSDVWALGVVLYEMLAGRPLFESPTIGQAIAWLSSERSPRSLCAELPEVTPALEAVIFRCLSRKISDRTPNVAALAGDLLEAIDSPDADLVRAKLAAMMDPLAPRDSSKMLAAIAEDAENRSSRARRAARGPTSAPPKRSRRVAVVALGAVLAGVVAWAMHRPAQAPAVVASASAAVASIHVAVHATPPEARIDVDGTERGTGSVSFDVAPDDKKHVVRISAPGYAPAERSVRFSKDVQVDEELDAAAAIASAASTAAPSRTVAPHPAAHPKAPAGAAAADSPCAAPYYFANGIKTFKPECL
jgi:eukaryotic-like serine/threonine-protein kinase